MAFFASSSSPSSSSSVSGSDSTAPPSPSPTPSPTPTVGLPADTDAADAPRVTRRVSSNDLETRTESTHAEASVPGRVVGRCHAIYAFDIGLGVDTPHAARIVQEHERRQLVRRWRVPKWVQYRVPPLTFSRPVDPVQVGQWTTREHAVFTVFDFGAVSVRFEIEIDGPVEELAGLSELLYDNPKLLEASEARVRDLIDLLRPAIKAPEMGVAMEDFVVFEFSSWSEEAEEPAEFAMKYGEGVASLLLADRGPLAPTEVERCLGSGLSYSPHDLALVHWHAAVVFHADATDIMTVLEHANVELLELRELDHELDSLLNRSTELIGSGIMDYIWPMSHASRRARDLIALHTDHAMMFEGVTNAIKLFGDEYLARLHRLTAMQMNAPEWHDNVTRKLQAAEGVYDRIIQQEGNRRMEILEIIIILLIAISIILPFIGLKGY